MYNIPEIHVHIYTRRCTYMHIPTRISMTLAVLLIVLGVSLGLKDSDRCTTGPITVVSGYFAKVNTKFSG